MARSRSAAASAHQRTLEDLRLKYPDLAWVERDATDTEEILADVSQGKVQYTLASSTEFALNRSVHPELAIALDLSPERALTWVVSTAGDDSSLLDRVNAFFVLARHDGMIAALLERYYGQDDRFDYLFSRNFMEHLQSRLPVYLTWFQQAAPAARRSTGGCSRRWVTRNRSGIRTLFHSRACAA